MKIFNTACNRIGKGVALILGLLCVNNAIGGGIQIEKVLRDYQARHKLVTGTYIEWLKCSQKSSPAPHFPKDGFYGDLHQDPEEGVRILTNLVMRFYTNNAIFSAFVNATNGYNSIENVTNIANYTMSDITVVPISDVTPATYAEKLKIVADQVAKLILIQTNATQEFASLNDARVSLDVAHDDGPDDCAASKNCLASYHSTNAWGSGHQYNGCVSIEYDDTFDSFNVGKIGLWSESCRYGLAPPYEYHAGAVNLRGRIHADLTPYKEGTVKVLLKLGLPDTTWALLAAFGSPSPVFGQSRPTSADQDKYGVWPGGVLTLGGESTTGYVTGSDTVPVMPENCEPIDVMLGWTVSDALAVVQPNFTTTPDSQDCCPCTCEPGTVKAGISSVHVDIGLGSDAFGSSAGSLILSAELPSIMLAKPLALRYTTNLTTYFVKDANTNHLQFKSSQALVNIKTNNAYYYTISVYTAADAGPTNGSGFHEPTGGAYTTIAIDNPDSGSASNRLRIIRTSEGASMTNEYTHAVGQWELSLGGGLRKETKASYWAPGNTNRYETNIVKTGNQVTYKEINVYTLFPWGEERTTNVVNPDGAALTNTWSYYTNTADAGSYRQLKQEISSSGRWTTNTYDSAGREIKRVTGFLNETSSSENLNRVISTIYSNNTPQITIIEKILGVTNSVQYKVISPGEVRDIRCQTVGAAWNDNNNLETITRKYTNGSFAGELYRVVNPDDTVQIHSYSTNATEKTTVVLSGIPDGGSETNITRGTITTTVNGLGGEIKSRTVKYKMSTGSEFTIDQDTYTYLDARKRSYQVAHLDGTTSEYQYACCGLSSEINREGTTTTYKYDGLQRQIGTTRVGITITNLLDANGNVLATVRVGTNDTTMTLSTGTYDLGGRLTNSTNALSQPTTYNEAKDGAGQTVRTTTYADTGTRIETFAKDGTLLKITGAAVRPVRYTNYVESGGADAERFYTLETKLDAAYADTSETIKTYVDPVGRVYKTLFPDNSYSQSYFNAKGQLTNSVDPDGVRTLYTYNDLGELSVTALDMDRDGVIDYAGSDRIVRITNDVRTGSSTPIQRTRQYVWATDGVNSETLALTREDGYLSGGTYTVTDSFGVTEDSETIYQGSGVRLVFKHTAAAALIGTSFRNGRPSTNVITFGGTLVRGTGFTYDGHGRQATATDARNGPTTYTYNNADQVASVTTPSPTQVTTNYFDNMGRIWRVGLPDSTSVTNEFYTTGDLKKTYGSRTYPVEYAYDAQGRLTNMTTWTGYPSTGPANTKWGYDARGFVTNKVYADDKGVSYTYTPTGRLRTRVWARGVTTTYTTNAAGEIATVVYSDGTPGMTNTYDRLGRLTTVVQGANATTMVYGSAGQLLSETCNGFTVTNTYDYIFRRTNVSVVGYPSTAAAYEYDLASRLTSVINGDYSASYAYHSNSPLVKTITFKQTNSTRLTTTKNYDNLNRLTSITNAPSVGSAIAFNYAYNSANQRTAVTNSDSRWAYQYDGLGQVTSGKKYWTDGTIVAGQQFEYSFDDIGNRKYAGAGGDEWGGNLRYSHYTANNVNQHTSRTVPGRLNVLGAATNSSTVTVNDGATYRKGEYYRGEVTVDNASAAVYKGITNLAVLNQGTNADIVTNITGNLFLPQTPEAFFYDADGNLTNDGRWIYIWDAENRLSSMTNKAGMPSSAKLKLSFTYDYYDRRTWKVVSTWNGSDYVAAYTNKFVYDGWHLIGELDHTNGLVRTLVWGIDLSGGMHGAGGVGGLLAINVPTNGAHFPAFDGNGNIGALVSASNGIQTAIYEYGPLGEIIRAEGTAASSNPLRFSSKYQDVETDLIYYGYRYYSMSSGRWLGRDPVEEEGGLNVYGFVDNDAVSSIDPLGEEILVIAGRYKDRGTYFSLETAQSDWGTRRFANQVRRAFQEIIGDCAELNITDAGTDRLSVRTWTGTKTVERKRFRIAFSNEKPSCRCDDCWQLLKRAIEDTRSVVEIRVLLDRDNAAYDPSTDSVYINPGINVRLPEQTPKGYRRKPTPFSIVLWHEAIGHDYQSLGHPDVPANHTPTWDGVYVDPTIQEENRARNCTRLGGKRYGGFLGLFKRSLGDRIPTYYDNP